MLAGLFLSPRRAANAVFARVAAGGDLSRFYARFPLDISPPVDDRPFFFHCCACATASTAVAAARTA